MDISDRRNIHRVTDKRFKRLHNHLDVMDLRLELVGDRFERIEHKVGAAYRNDDD